MLQRPVGGEGAGAFGPGARVTAGGGSRRTCTACRSAKVRCDRLSPMCGRCQRLNLPCVEQVRKQGRPSLQERQQLHAAVAAALGTDICGGGSSHTSGGGGGGGGGGEAPTTTLLMGPVSSSSSLGAYPTRGPGSALSPKPRLVGAEDEAAAGAEGLAAAAGAEGLAAAAALARECGPQTVAEYVLGAFERLEAAGEVYVARTLALLRTMALQSLCWKKDFSCGLLDALLARLGLTLPDIEAAASYPDDTPACLAHLGVKLGPGYEDVTAPSSSASASAASGAAADNGQAAPEEQEEDKEEGANESSSNSSSTSGSSPTSDLGIAFGRLPSRLLALDDRVAAAAGTVAVQGGAWRVVVNQQFSDLFCPAADLSARILAGGVAPPLCYAALVAPEDRVDFLEAMTRYLFGKHRDVELSQIVRMRDCFDAPFLAVARLRVLTLAGGAYTATMLTVTPAPSSKYIRGGNREELGPSWMGLNFAEARFRTRQPSAPMSELGGRFVSENVRADAVRRFFGERGGGKAALAEAMGRYRVDGGEGAAAAAMGTEPLVVVAAAPAGAVPAPAGAVGMDVEEPEGGEGVGVVVVGIKRPRSPEAAAAGAGASEVAEEQGEEGRAMEA